MSTERICENCEFAVWGGSTLICVNEEGEEYKHYVMPDDICDQYMRYAGDGDDSATAGAIK